MPKKGISRKDFLGNSAFGMAGLALGSGIAPASASPGTAVASTKNQPGEPDYSHFRDAVVLITGATSGIGEATARLFAEAGSKVFFCGRRRELGKQVEASIRENGGEATYMYADVREEPQVREFTEACVQTYGRIDIAFNNAGIEGPNGQFDEIAMEGEMGYHDLMKTNVDGVIYAMRYELPVMRRQESGMIVNVGSMLSHRGSDTWGAYAASKHAVIGMTRSAAIPNARYGIRVMSISPGGTRTELLRRFLGGSLEGAGANSPMGRIAEPEEIGRVVMGMCDPKLTFLNGDDVKADGASSA
jgi:NAD(P)-dependent dehydrogenase (short-subunit alcohol dehydrogenase family)